MVRPKELRSQAAALALAGVLLAATGAQPQEDYGSRLGRQRGGEVSYEPTGPGVLFGALDPSVRRWYVPQELYNLYQWKQWEYTNYAREAYRRYVSITNEGEYFYDLYGSFISKGWLIYDWRQDQPQQFGSVIFKDPKFSSWFNNVVISSDHRGQNHMSLTIGNQIRTTLTPMTFSKPTFDGLQADFQTDKYEMTMLLSRVSSPGLARSVPVETTNSTNLFGFHGRGQVGDFVRVGATYINAHNSQTLLESFQGDPLSGSLTVGQNLEHIGQIFIRLSDDSPEDRKGGAALFSYDIIIEAEEEALVDGELVLQRRVVRGSELGFNPTVEGGFQRLGYLAADGEEAIILTYDFRDPSYNGPDLSTIRRAQIELALANDYHVEIGSDRQTNLPDRQPVYLTLKRAAGNVRDGSNLRLLRFDYGLPTANDIAGFTFEVQDVLGFSFYGEFDRSRQFRKYPNRAFNTHRTAQEVGDAWMMNLSRQSYPWFLFGEAYSMDHNYATTTLISSPSGDIDYTDPTTSYYEWVEDNDDQDSKPDWQRLNQFGPDLDIFPGWDENNDFISDFNQNDTEFRPNFIPDYEEPFLRYNADRPEFLFGVDMNNNLWIDRFENDEEPDFPYDRNRRGGNGYLGVHLTPEMQLTVGHKQERMLSAKREDRGTYGQFTLDSDLPGLGRWRFYAQSKKVKDDIPDDLVQWVQPEGAPGALQRIPDPLAAPDTWINTAYLGFDYTGIKGLTLGNKLKYQVWHQLQDQPDFREDYRFFGMINKGEYPHTLGRVTLSPKLKNELRLESPLIKNDPSRRENTLIFFLLARTRFLVRSEVQAGFEYTLFSQLRDPVPAGLQDDFSEAVWALQFSNTGDYMGYKLTTQLGLRASRIDRKGEEAFTGVSQFVTVYAAIQ